MKGSYIIYPDVSLGENVLIEEFCIVGIPIKKANRECSIGNNSYIRSGTYIYQGNDIGNNFITGNKANIRENNQIGNNVSIGTHSVIEHNVKIGDNVRIHSQVFIPEYSVLEENSWIGPNVVFTNSKFPNRPNSKKNLIGPKIGKFAALGANSTILPSIVIGQHSIVGAGSVVTKNVPDFSIVAGNPAKIIGKVEQA
tara:strand:+ start:5045 stop:5635 length:591 start_codon:yes stop_codon:yes gene_type:complete